MPLYNSKDYISEAIESILNQSFSSFEFIIVDDSNDGSYDIAQSYAMKDKRIKLIKNDPPLGLRISSNIGLKEAKGKYVIRMEADDISLPDRIEKQYNFMEDNPQVDVSGCFLQLFGQSEEQWKYPLEHSAIKAGLIWGITIAHPTTIMKREFLLKGGFFYNEVGLPYCEDWEFFYDMSKEAVFSNLPELLYLYRRWSESVTKRMKSKKNKVKYELTEKIFDDLGIDKEYVESHLFLNGVFLSKVDKVNLKKTYKWSLKLLQINKEKMYFDQNILKKDVEKRWNRLFYLILDHNKNLFYYYFLYSKKINFKKLIYWIKLAIKG